MNAATRELLRNNLLLQLSASGERGIAFSTLVLGAKMASFKVDDDAVANELAYLKDKGLAADVQKTLSPENRRTRITSTGRDYLAEEGLA